ncbi:MAG: AAA family ATPase, partial [Dysgonamonadaceae bacterium]|nr:AAA family ATPase [Dysgonamonadaceae bacterium]
MFEQKKDTTMLNNRKLPIGIQDFEDLRTNEYLYVDKTAYIYQLKTRGKPYFLGRPRRFGKSLFLSTLKAFFLGKKELFEGLAIAGLEKEWIEYPVFYLDFNLEDYSTLSSFHYALDANLVELEARWGSDEREKTPALRLNGLIRRACEQTGRKVVVLVDEYDKPLIETMDNAKLNETIRKRLKGFYGVLKRADANLRFVFLTGVTKFSQVSVFSDLNHLVDI